MRALVKWNDTSSHHQIFTSFPANFLHSLLFHGVENMRNNIRTHNSGQDADPRRNNSPQYNLRPLRPQVEEQGGDELPPVVERRAARRQPHDETKMERLEQCLDTLTELFSTLIAALGQIATNVAPAIPPGIPFANPEGGEPLPPQEGEDATASEALIETSQRRRRAWCRGWNVTQPDHEDRELTP